MERGVAASVRGLGVRAGCQQHLDELGAAHLGGNVQGRAPMMVGHVDRGTGLEEKANDLEPRRQRSPVNCFVQDR